MFQLIYKSMSHSVWEIMYELWSLFATLSPSQSHTSQMVLKGVYIDRGGRVPMTLTPLEFCLRPTGFFLKNNWFRHLPLCFT